MSTVILQGPDLTGARAAEFAAELGGRLESRPRHWRVNAPGPVTPERLQAWRARAGFDVNILPPGFDPRAVRLVVSDMDSTLINIECVDEIADLIGIKPQVAAITAAAMRGEIDFATSLTQRIALLAGIAADALERVYRERLRLNPGAEALITGARERGIKFALVSGGFTFFTERLRERLRLDYTLANELEIAGGRLTGRVQGEIVGAEAKAGFLQRLCRELAIEPRRAIAIGDGANDLKMMGAAGLSVAYRAKPAVQAAADVALNHSGLDAVLELLGA